MKENSVVTQDFSAEALISQAIASKLPVETMERLLAMRRELKAEYARERFNLDMASFQAECPVIRKTREVRTNAGAHAYSYAPLEEIMSQVKELVRDRGFSYSTQTETKEGSVRSTVIVHHRDGHQEESSMEVPLGNQTGVMSRTQVVAAALTYAKRYAFCNAFGILTGDEDTDAAPSPEDTDRLRHDVQQAIDSLDAAVSLEELKEVFSALGPVKSARTVIEAKDRRKEELS